MSDSQSGNPPVYDHTRTCPECQGWGRESMLTLDDIEIHTEVACARCDGDGVIDIYEEPSDV